MKSGEGLLSYANVEHSLLSNLATLEKQTFSNHYIPPMRSLSKTLANLALLIDSTEPKRLTSARCKHLYLHDKHVLIQMLLFFALVWLNNRCKKLELILAERL